MRRGRAFDSLHHAPMRSLEASMDVLEQARQELFGKVHRQESERENFASHQGGLVADSVGSVGITQQRPATPDLIGHWQVFWPPSRPASHSSNRIRRAARMGDSQASEDRIDPIDAASG